MAFSFKRPQSKPDRRALGYAAVWGGLTAVALVLLTAVCQSAGYKPGAPLTWISYTLLLISLTGGPLHYRRQLVPEAPFNTRQAYLMCVFQALLTASLFVLLFHAYMSWIDLDFMADFKERQRLYWERYPDVAEPERVERLQYIGDMRAGHILWNVWGELVMIGVLFPLLIALMVRKDR
ncbi:MAG: DUF4199 domain-containing protein [Bacteroidales bacterium]|nr:DUF4199 domain-containing protein [Bacteroidales bacterium]